MYQKVPLKPSTPPVPLVPPTSEIPNQSSETSLKLIQMQNNFDLIKWHLHTYHSITLKPQDFQSPRPTHIMDLMFTVEDITQEFLQKLNHKVFKSIGDLTNAEIIKKLDPSDQDYLDITLHISLYSRYAQLRQDLIAFCDSKV